MFLCKADQTSHDGAWCLCVKQVKPAVTLCAWWVSLCKASQTSHDCVHGECLCAKQVKPAMTVCMVSVFVQSRSNQPWLCAWWVSLCKAGQTSHDCVHGWGFVCVCVPVWCFSQTRYGARPVCSCGLYAKQMQQACLCACKVYLRLKAKRGWPDILISVSEQTAGGECSLKKNIWKETTYLHWWCQFCKTDT